MLVAAALSPMLQALMAPLHVAQLHRIFNRLTMFGVLAASAWLLVHNGLATREVLGYAVYPRKFLRQASVGLVAGLALMLLILVPLFWLGVRVWDQRLPQSLPGLLALGGKALLSGCGVALVEETFFRGAMQGSMTRAGSVRAAILAVPVFYAAIHFFGEAVRFPIDQVTATSGFVIFAGFFRKFAYPGQIFDAFVALYLIGVMLGLLRHYTGNIAACMGLHTGVVAAFIVVRKASTFAPDSDWSFLVGPFNQVLGVWAIAIALLACLVVWQWGQRSAQVHRHGEGML